MKERQEAVVAVGRKEPATRARAARVVGGCQLVARARRDGHSFKEERVRASYAIEKQSVQRGSELTSASLMRLSGVQTKDVDTTGDLATGARWKAHRCVDHQDRLL